MSYRLEWEQDAVNSLDSLTPRVKERIVDKVKWLAGHVEELPHESLKGPLAGYFRFRIGAYRAVYSLVHADRLLVVHDVGHRREVYHKRHR